MRVIPLYTYVFLLTICGIPPRASAPPPAKRPRLEQECIVHEGVGKLRVSSSCDNETEVDFIALADLQTQRVPQNVPNYKASNMADLILSRMGLFEEPSEADLNRMLICPKHLEEIGTKWHELSHRPKILGRNRERVPKCVMPLVHGAPRHVGNREGAGYVTKQQSYVLWREKSVFVPLGSAVCRQHRTYLRTLAPEAAPQCAQDEVTTCGDPDWEDDGVSGGSDHEDTQGNIMRETKRLIRRIAVLNGITNVHASGQFGALSDASKRKRAAGVSSLIDTIYKALAPDAADELRTLVGRKQTISSTWQRKYSKTYAALMESIADAYENAETRTERSMVLSIIAPVVSLEELQSHIPGVTEYAHTKARRYAKMRAAGISWGRTNTPMVRYSRAKVNSFIQFITSPHIVVDLPFGEKKVAYSSGVKTEVANVVRTMVNERIVSQYEAYLQQLGQANLTMSRSTCLRILDVCKATTRKTMRGLDYITYKGVEGIDALAAITEKIKGMSGDAVWANNIIRGLREAKFFLKGDYKRGIQLLAAAKEFSLSYALSDPSQPAFRAVLNQSHTTGRCVQCHAMNETIYAIRDKIFEVTWQKESEKTEALYEWQVASEGIRGWQKHILRTINQDRAKDTILRNLEPNQVFLQLDWAMKFLPSQGRESMSEWYGKRGVNWHITVAFVRDIRNNVFHQRTFVHVFDSVEQGASAIIAVLMDTLARIHAERPQLEEAFLRSDNAGCYHGSQMIAAIPVIQRNATIQIKRWDFSEAQSGKGPCDRAAATIKRHISLHVAENHKCRNADEFLQSSSSNGGVKSVTFIQAHLALPPRQPKVSIASISKYNNFEFHQAAMRVWNAYGIGAGLQVDYPRTTEALPSLQVLRSMTAGAADENLLRRPPIHSQPHTNYWYQVLGRKVPSDQTCSQNAIEPRLEEEELEDSESDEHNIPAKMFECPEQGCVKVYQYEGNLANHLRLQKHVYNTERQSLRDYAIDTYKENLQRLQLYAPNIPNIENAIRSVEADELAGAANSEQYPVGWALPSARKIVRFSPAQKAFLKLKFNEGITIGRKHTPQAVAEQMRRDPQFPDPTHWLTWQQIASYWSRIAREREQDIDIDVDIDFAIDEQDEEDLVSQEPYVNAMEAHIEAAIDTVLDAVLGEGEE